MCKKIAILFLSFYFLSYQLFAQSDSLAKLSIENIVTVSFPSQYNHTRATMRENYEGNYNDITYSLFISEEFAYSSISNTIELDSLYGLISHNILSIYSGEFIESKTYYTEFGPLRGLYVSVKSTTKENPYEAEYYTVCVNGKIYVMSTTYLATAGEKVAKQAKDFVNTIHFNPSLTWQDQMNVRK